MTKVIIPEIIKKFHRTCFQMEDMQKKKGDVDMRVQQNIDLVPLPVPPPGSNIFKLYSYFYNFITIEPH